VASPQLKCADCGAIFAKVLDRLASGALRLPPAKRHRAQNIADALRDADGAPREGKPLLDLSPSSRIRARKLGFRDFLAG
jgi:hypothetical protein